MCGDQGDHRQGHHAHARHRGGRRRSAAGRRRVRLIITPAPADPVAFAGGTLDRAAHRRTDPDWLAAARRDPRARAIVVGSSQAHPDPLPLTAAEQRDGDGQIFLGVTADGPLFAVRRDDVELTGLRDLATRLPAAQLGLLAYAAAMVHWADAARFCGRCGQPAVPRDGGHVRACAEGHELHPRTDPVVIMLVTDGDRVILGRQRSWPAGRYSALAGFVEPGEALEAAVAREVDEEAGVIVSDVRFVASQPWPFPSSLMLGFHADFVGGEPVPADAELEDVRWFSRAEIAAAATGTSGPGPAWIDGAGSDDLLLPPSTAIARLLIDRWLASDPDG